MKVREAMDRLSRCDQNAELIAADVEMETLLEILNISYGWDHDGVKVVVMDTTSANALTLQSPKSEIVKKFEACGWVLRPSGGGCEWLVKDGEGGFSAVTDIGGLNIPSTWDEPCILGFYNMEGIEVGHLNPQPTSTIYTLVRSEEE